MNIKTENVSFGGMEAKGITLEQMNAMFENVYKDSKDLAHHVLHRGCLKFFKDNFKKDWHKDQLYGLRVYERMYVPFGEIWMCDKHGRPISKIKLAKI